MISKLRQDHINATIPQLWDRIAYYRGCLDADRAACRKSSRGLWEEYKAAVRQLESLKRELSAN